MGRILGIDYGKKRVGLAVTDPLKIFASPLITVTVQEFDSFIEDYLKSEMIDEFVIGYPVNLNNEPSESVKYIDPFIKRLRKKFPGKPLHLVDERFTSQMALRSMIDGGVKKKDRQNKMIADKVSASIILQSFLDNRSAMKEKRTEMTYPIVIYGHPVLRKVAVDIDWDYPGLKQLVDDLFETMYKSEGLGLAAPQIGKSIRIFVIDGAPVAEDEPELADFKRAFINAHIVEKSGEIKPMTEGCLSIPHLREEVNRESHIRITYYDENWEFHDEIYDGYKARIIQHEYDHLDGILFTDKVNPLRKRLLRSKLLAISKGRFEADYKTILPGQKIKSA